MTEETASAEGATIDTPDGPMDAASYLATLEGGEPVEAEAPPVEEEVAPIEETLETEAPAEETEEELLDLGIPEDSEEAPSEGGATESFGVEAFNEYNQEFIENNGTLGEESRGKLQEQFNVSPEVLDLVLKGIQAQRQINTTRALSEADLTVSQYKEIVTWSKANESKEQQAERSRLLKSEDPSVRSLALKDLKSAYTAGMPEAEPTHTRAAVPAAKKQDFTSYLNKAMANPLYTSASAAGDAYRATVEETLARLS